MKRRSKERQISPKFDVPGIQRLYEAIFHKPHPSRQTSPRFRQCSYRVDYPHHEIDQSQCLRVDGHYGHHQTIDSRGYVWRWTNQKGTPS